MKKTQFKKGGVSMFLVVITCGLVALMVASFVRLTVRDQQQASNQDLSQSAYDSAQVGVEDAKRLLNIYAEKCANGADLSTKDCKNIYKAILDNKCHTLHAFGSGVNGDADGETKVKSTSSSKSDLELDQAYTCVKIKKNTGDFIGKMTVGQSKIVPLKGVRPFRTVILSWHSKDDVVNNGTISLPAFSKTPSLVENSKWSANSPAVVKSQFFGYTTAINNLAQLDEGFAKNGNGLDERIYFPVSSSASGVSKDSLPNGSRRDGVNRTKELSQVKCVPNLNSAAYACSVEIDLGHNVAPTDHSFMRLTPIYKSSNFKVELKDSSGAIVEFDGVQPQVDSTGRANDKFRRVESRIEFADQNLPVPDFALQVENSDKAICKNFWVTNKRNNLDTLPAECK